MELIDIDKTCLEILEGLPKVHSRHCMRSAVHHLERAERLFDVDTPMAMFRCITAEEEAASGVIRCLRELKYPNAERLNPRNHKHKNSIIAFMRVLRTHVLKAAGESGIHLDLATFQEQDRKVLKLLIVLQGNTEATQLELRLPLDIALQPHSGQPLYQIEASEFATSQGAKSFLAHVEEQANTRNMLLYATPHGYPRDVTFDRAKYFPAMQARVFSLIRLYLLLAPYRQHQAYVVQATNALLQAMTTLPSEEPGTNGSEQC